MPLLTRKNMSLMNILKRIEQRIDHLGVSFQRPIHSPKISDTFTLCSLLVK